MRSTVIGLIEQNVSLAKTTFLIHRRETSLSVMVTGFSFYWLPIVAINCNELHPSLYPKKHLSCQESDANKAWSHHLKMASASYDVLIAMFAYSFISQKCWIR